MSDLKSYKMLIGGEWVDAAGGDVLAQGSATDEVAKPVPFIDSLERYQMYLP